MIELIPAIDLMEGRCVRLVRGDFAARTEYFSEPLQAAKRFEAAGLKRLHLVDLDGARAGTPKHLAVLEAIAAGTALRIDFSGGLRSAADVEAAFNAGAAQIAAGSIAVKQQDVFLSWLAAFGAERVILAADVRDGRIAVHGWTASSGASIVDFLGLFQGYGVRQVLCTDIVRDGMLAGPSPHLYTDLKGRFPDLHIIASGGVACVEDITRLEALGLGGVIIGKALYEERITLSDLERFLC